MESAEGRLSRVLDRIDKAARRSGRNAQEITLVAVTKAITFDRILPLLQAGVDHVGENRIQEALQKYQNSDGTKKMSQKAHLIGQLQTNKAKKAATFFDMVQSLDRIDLADDLDRHAAAAGKRLPCLVEVKVSPEETKSGAPPERLHQLLGQLRDKRSLEIQGLMGIAPYSDTAESARPFFRKLRKLFEQTKLTILSMGMSADFEVAIEEGATMVRIGTALFGDRA